MYSCICLDKDECADKSHECHKNAVCVNKVGGYECHCKPGYKQLKEGRLCKEKGKQFQMHLTAQLPLSQSTDYMTSAYIRDIFSPNTIAHLVHKINNNRN